MAIEQQMQKVLEETQLDMNEFDNLLQPIIDTCTKDAISVSNGKIRARWYLVQRQNVSYRFEEVSQVVMKFTLDMSRS